MGTGKLRTVNLQTKGGGKKEGMQTIYGSSSLINVFSVVFVFLNQPINLFYWSSFIHSPSFSHSFYLASPHASKRTTISCTCLCQSHINCDIQFPFSIVWSRDRNGTESRSRIPAFSNKTGRGVPSRYSLFSGIFQSQWFRSGFKIPVYRKKSEVRRSIRCALHVCLILV